MSLEQQSMIASLEFGLPRQSCKLPEEAKKIEEQNNAKKGTVRASMYYFRKNDPDPKKKRQIDGLSMLVDYQTEYRNRFRMLAKYPYSGNFYLVPSASVDDCIKLIEQFEGEKKSAVWQKWADDEYYEWLNSAPERMGDLYQKADFPTLSDCMARFRCQMHIMPLAPKEQIARIALIAPKTQQFLMTHADEAAKKAVADLHKQIWADLMAPLEKIVTTFEKDKPKVFESLLGNLFDIVSVIPNYSEMLKDDNLTNAAKDIQQKLGKITTEDLKKSDEHRKEALSAAKNLINQLTPFARKFS